MLHNRLYDIVVHACMHICGVLCIFLVQLSLITVNVHSSVKYGRLHAITLFSHISQNYLLLYVLVSSQFVNTFCIPLKLY